MSLKSFLDEMEALVDKYLPLAVGAADVGAAASLNPELIPIINEAGGIAEGALTATQDAQAGSLGAAVNQAATVITSIKALAAGTAQPAIAGGPGPGSPGGPH